MNLFGDWWWWLDRKKELIFPPSPFDWRKNFPLRTQRNISQPWGLAVLNKSCPIQNENLTLITQPGNNLLWVLSELFLDTEISHPVLIIYSHFITETCLLFCFRLLRYGRDQYFEGIWGYLFWIMFSWKTAKKKPLFFLLSDSAITEIVRDTDTYYRSLQWWFFLIYLDFIWSLSSVCYSWHLEWAEDKGKKNLYWANRKITIFPLNK